MAAVSSEINDGKSKWVRKLTGHNRIGKQLWLNLIPSILDCYEFLLNAR